MKPFTFKTPLTFKLLLSTLLFGFCLNNSAYSLPVDWNGTLGFDTNLLYDYRRTTNDFDDGINTGSTGIAPGSDSTSFQSYVFKLNPSIIVNDSATIKAEFGMGNVRSDLLAENTTDGDEPSKSYFHTSPNNTETLNVNQLYLLLYADTALIKVGKFSKHMGLGALFNEGKDPFDRFFTLYNGIEFTFNLGNFSIAPLWSKLSTTGEADRDRDNDGENDVKYASGSGKNDVTEKGFSASYKNSKTNFNAGFYYATRTAESRNGLYSNGETDITVTDIWFDKSVGNFNIKMEIPMLTGKIRDYYGTDDEASLDTNAFLVETKMKTKSNWSYGLNAGSVRGDDGESDAFEGMYLHPNFKIARILFQYNYDGFNDANENIFNVSVTNVEYAKLFAMYEGSTWNWTFSALMAKAKEVAIEGDVFFDHRNGTLATAVEDQNSDMGYEFDIEFSYLWNPNIRLGGHFALLSPGKFFEFDNNADDKIDLKNPYSFGLNVGVTF